MPGSICLESYRAIAYSGAQVGAELVSARDEVQVMDPNHLLQPPLPLKAVGARRYVHRDAVARLSPDAAAAVFDAEEIAGSSSWTVAKLDLDDADRVSLLTYEDFEQAFPALLESTTVNRVRQSAKRRSYRMRANPPILHRKELLLDVQDPRRAVFAELTAALEARGLFASARFIGTRLAWGRRLEEAGLWVDGHLLRERGRGEQPPPASPVQRHLAAIARQGLSLPIRLLFRYGVIDRQMSVFDYGCGHGSDVEGLSAAGISAEGWDPYFAPDVAKRAADVVNLGFVLNVIEHPLERLEVIRDAFALATRCLAVAVITSSNARLERARPYGDGFLTSRGTFQKFFRMDELKGLLERELRREAFQVGPGVFFLFRDELVEQDYLARRQQGWRPPLGHRTRSQPLASSEALRPDLEALWSRALELGRMPAQDELDADLRYRLAAGAGSLRAAAAQAQQTFERQDLDAAQTRRRDDLLVFFALNIFNRRLGYRQLPPRLQRDLKALFGSYSEAQDRAKALLFSIGRPEVVVQGCVGAEQAGVGWLDADSALMVHTGLLDRLPAILRCLTGCGLRYYGGLDDAQIVKIHARSGKLTALIFEDFDAPLPKLRERIKIDLKSQRIFEFDHGSDDQRLVMKSRYMAPDQLGFTRQTTFDKSFLSLGGAALGPRPQGKDISDMLAKAGYVQKGYLLVSQDAAAPS